MASWRARRSPRRAPRRSICFSKDLHRITGIILPARFTFHWSQFDGSSRTWPSPSDTPAKQNHAKLKLVGREYKKLRSPRPRTLTSHLDLTPRPRPRPRTSLSLLHNASGTQPPYHLSPIAPIMPRNKGNNLQRAIKHRAAMKRKAEAEKSPSEAAKNTS
jgi:hypothetical protein